MRTPAALLLLAGLAACAPGAPRSPAAPLVLVSTGLDLPEAGEVLADIDATCDGCNWGRRGFEAAVLRLDLDGHYAQHVVLARGTDNYRVALGRLAAGVHRLDVALEPRLTCGRLGRIAVTGVRYRHLFDADPQAAAAAHAPFLYLREDTLPAFTDLPLVMWYEEEATATGRRLRYSVVFSNEDGGTPPDRLMATWGRVTDIEYVYGVELDAAGRVVREEYQGPEHRLLPFDGRTEGAHPLLWVATPNNMVAPAGAGTYRVAPEPWPFDLSDTSREAVMDRLPWTYRVSAQEVRREGRVRDGATPGSRQIPDPRRFVTLEACAEMADAALAFAVGVRRHGRTEWTWSDAGPLRWGIVRSPDNVANGCFRGAVALPGRAPIVGLRFRSWPRPQREGEAPLPAGAGRAVLRRVNRLFPQRGDDTPGPSLFSWTGALALEPDGAPVELAVPANAR